MPVESISHNDIVIEDGFLAKLNSGKGKEKMSRQFENTSSLQFRLPSETEGEYAAKGGIR